jgi:hypothetical protein
MLSIKPQTKSNNPRESIEEWKETMNDNQNLFLEKTNRNKNLSLNQNRNRNKNPNMNPNRNLEKARKSQRELKKKMIQTINRMSRAYPKYLNKKFLHKNISGLIF